jgi:hypothetical protein
MKLAVVGAYGNGKTTLTTALSQELGIPRTHGFAMRDPIGQPGKSLEDSSEPELFQLTVRRLMERAADEARMVGGFISDGSILHEWVYLTVRLVLGRNPAPSMTLDSAPRTDRTVLYEGIADQIGLVAKHYARDAYDTVLHLPAEVPLASGHRPISEHFRTLSDKLMLAVLRELDYPVHIVHGSVVQRLHHVLRLLDMTGRDAPSQLTGRRLVRCEAE